VAPAVALTAVLAGCSEDDPAPDGGGGSVSAQCDYTANDDPVVAGVGIPEADVSLAPEYRATVATNRGDIVLDLDASLAPCTVNAFVLLADSGAFDDTPCAKLTSERSGGRFLECGDPTGDGAGSAGFDVPLENTGTDPYRAGQVVAAPGSAGSLSRFRLLYDDSTLGGAYTRLGSVVAGQSLIDTIADAGVAEQGAQVAIEGPPSLRVVIESVTVEEA
jgi:peptidyl-prolyl cis-trans isomerase B (cyclophilin B)